MYVNHCPYRYTHVREHNQRKKRSGTITFYIIINQSISTSPRKSNHIPSHEYIELQISIDLLKYNTYTRIYEPTLTKAVM